MTRRSGRGKTLSFNQTNNKVYYKFEDTLALHHLRVYFFLYALVFVSLKMEYDNNLWIGCLTGVVIQKCIELANHRCPGCKAKLKSPLLHLHEQYSLLDKLHTYFNEVRGSLLPIVGQIYDSVKHRLLQSDDKNKDKENYTTHARFFFQTANPEIIYYARYLTEENDNVINELITQKSSRKRKNVTEKKETKDPVKKKSKKAHTPINLEELLGQAYRESVMDNYDDKYL